jgi:hypothetical protein
MTGLAQHEIKISRRKLKLNLLSIFIITISLTQMMGIFDFSNPVNATETWSQYTKENYSTYTEQDVGGWITITSSSTITFNARRTAYSWINKDKGAGNLGGGLSGWVSRVEVKSDFADDYNAATFWAMSNSTGNSSLDIGGINDNVQLAVSNSDSNLYLQERDGGTFYSDSMLLTANVWYYIRVSQSNYTLTAQVYSDSSYSTLIDTLSIILHHNGPWRYFWASSTNYAGGLDRQYTVYIANSAFKNPPMPATVTITSSYPGLGYVIVDGSNITTPHVFSWYVYDTHIISANSPVGEYVFINWSDSGAQSHIYTVTGNVTVTANFNIAISLKKTYYTSVYAISSSLDDAYYLIGYEFSNNSTLGYLKSNSYDNYVGFRFQNIIIPSMAYIDSAYISLYSSDAIDSIDYMTTIKGVNSDDYGEFVNSSTLSNAPILSSYVNWNMLNLEGNKWYNSSNIGSIIAQIKTDTGWISSNSIAFRFDSAESLFGTRSFRTYDYGSHQYAPKLYIRYYILTPIDINNPPDEIIDNYIYDELELIDNNTEGYQLWKIFNYTYINSYTVYDSSNHIYKFNTGSGWKNIASSSGLASYKSRKVVDSNNGTLYSFLPISDGGNYDLWLFKSIDDGNTWSQLIKVYDNAITLVSTSIDIAKGIGVIYMAYLRSSHPYYKTYDIGTLTLSSEVALTYGATNSPTSIEMLVNSNANYRIAVYDGRGGAGSGYAAYWNKDTSTWNYLGIQSSATYNSGSVACALFEDGHSYFAMANFYPYVGISDLYIDTDYTYQRGGVSGSSDFVLDVEFEQDSSHIIITERSYNGAYSPDRLLKVERTGEKSGSSSAVKNIISNTVIGQIYSDSGLSMISVIDDYSYSYFTMCIGAGDLSAFVLIENGFMQNAIYYQRLIIGVDNPLYIITDENGVIVWEGITLPTWLDNIPELLSISINGKTNGTYWLFKNEVYNMTAITNNTNLIYLNFTDTVHTIIFYYNNITELQRMYVYNADGTLVNENVANGISVSKTIGSNQTLILSWKFILSLNIVDCQNKSVNYSLSFCNSTTGLIYITNDGVSNLSFNIYNLGGLVSYSFNGDGGHTLGGSPFELYATNSSIDSYAYSEIIYRRLQLFHALVELNTDNIVEAVEHFEPLVNIGSYEIGFDYKLDGYEDEAWITGWSAKIYLSEIAVGTYGAGTDKAYIAMTVMWYNKGDFVRGDQYIYSYHFGYDKTGFPSNRRSITFWADLWFDKSNSSTVFGGRINTEYYGYYEDGVNFWFGYGGFRPMTGNVTASMIFGNVKDANGDITPSKNIGLVRVWEKVSKTASAGDSDTYTVKPFQVFDLKVSQDRMDGIDTPVFIEPKQLNIGGYNIFDPLLSMLGGLGSVISGALFGMGKIMIGSIDTILSWMGLPYGTFSGFVNMVMTTFNMLIGSLANVISMMSKALTLITTFVMTIVTFVDYIISVILFFGVDLFSIPIQIIALFLAVINGGTINFYGILLDFTSYAPLMTALKTLLPPMGGIMLTVWILWGNLTMSGEPDVFEAMGRIVKLFGMMRDLYNNVMWVFTRIRNELISIYNFLKSHIPGMGGGGGTIEEGGSTSG